MRTCECFADSRARLRAAPTLRVPSASARQPTATGTEPLISSVQLVWTREDTAQLAADLAAAADRGPAAAAAGARRQ